MSFEYPYLFIILLIYIVCEKFCKRVKTAIFFPHFDFIKENFDKLFILRFFIISFSLIALASPYKTETITQEKNGKSIVLSLDASGSMSEGNKFEIVKSVVSDFISKRKEDNIGLVVFGDVALIASPLTYDKNILNYALKRLQVGMAGRKTAISDSLAQSIKILKKSKAKTKIIILLTDGLENASKTNINKIVSIARKENIKIYTIGIGVDFDVRYLQQISYLTNAKSFRAMSLQDLQQAYDIIDRLEKTKLKSNKLYYKEYYFQYPLGVALLLSFIYLFFRRKDEIIIS